MIGNIVLVVGDKNSGKTTYLQNIVTRCKDKGYQVSGLLGIGTLKNGVKYSYHLMDVHSGKLRLFASKEKEMNNSFVYGSYHFNRSAITWGNKILRESRMKDIIFFDEYGPLEELGLGFQDELDWLLKNIKGILFISVRHSLKENVLNRIKLNLANSGGTESLK
jgi:nucleoside-triphosphatase THEP1